MSLSSLPEGIAILVSRGKLSLRGRTVANRVQRVERFRFVANPAIEVAAVIDGVDLSLVVSFQPHDQHVRFSMKKDVYRRINGCSWTMFVDELQRTTNEWVSMDIVGHAYQQGTRYRSYPVGHQSH